MTQKLVLDHIIIQTQPDGRVGVARAYRYDLFDEDGKWLTSAPAAPVATVAGLDDALDDTTGAEFKDLLQATEAREALIVEAEERAAVAMAQKDDAVNELEAQANELTKTRDSLDDAVAFRNATAEVLGEFLKECGAADEWQKKVSEDLRLSKWRS